MKTDSLPGLASALASERLVLRFGAIDGSDHDLLVVSSSAPYHQQVRLGCLDITVVPERLSRALADHCDPILAIPISTGDYVCGAESLRQELADRLGALVDRRNSASHNAKQALRCWQAALNHFESATTLAFAPFAELAASCAGWAMTYRAVSRLLRSAGSPPPWSIAELYQLPEGPVIRAARVLARRCRLAPDSVRLEEVEQIVSGIEELMVGLRAP